MTRRAWDAVANTVSDIRAILGGSSALMPKIAAAGIALAVLAGIIYTYEQKAGVVKDPALQKSGAAKDPAPQSPSPAASEPVGRSASAWRERVNKPTEVASVFTRIRGALTGFGLIPNDLFNTVWGVFGSTGKTASFSLAAPPLKSC